MSADSINYLYDFLGLNQNNFKVFYDFRSGDFLQSVPSGKEEFSGQIFGSQNFFKQDPFSSFDGGVGNFSGNYVKIHNSSGLISSRSTFIFSQEKTNFNDGVIFSSLEGGAIKSGFCLGINAANKLYFEYYNANQPIIRTSLNTVGDKNLYALKFGDGDLSFLYYNNNTCQLEKESFSVPLNNFSQSDNWYLGSGIGQKNYIGNLDKFLYFDNRISDSNLSRLMSGFWTDLQSGVSTGFLNPTGQITGYQTSVTGATGILSISNQFSGFDIDTKTQDVFHFITLTGQVESGNKVLEFLGDLPQFCSSRSEQPIFYEKTATENTTGVTGFEYVFSGTKEIEVQVPIYSQIFETGFISSGIISTPLFNTGQEPVLTPFKTVSPNIPLINSYGMNHLTFLGFNAGQQVFHEGQPVVFEDQFVYEDLFHWLEGRAFTGENRINFLNRISNFNLSNLQFQLSNNFPSGEVDVYKNGLYQVTGDYLITGGPFNFNLQIKNDYFISGNRLFFKNSVDQSDLVVYDFRNTGEKYIFNSGDFINEFLPISTSSYWFFQNGKKLISGLDYQSSGDNFSGSQWVLNGMPISAIQKRNGQINLFNDNYIRSLTFPQSEIILSNTTGENPEFEIASGFLSPLPAEFKGEFGSYFLNSGVFDSGVYTGDSGSVFFPSYTGWQLYSGNEIFDIKFDLESPPTGGWDNDTELIFGWDDSPQYSVSGEKFLRGTSSLFQSRVRTIRTLEHGKIDLIKGNQTFENGFSNFFIDNQDFWN